MAKRFTTVFLWAWVITMAPMFLVVRYFEIANVFDSIGAWYTFLVAAVFSLPIGLAVALGSAALLARSKEGP